MKTTDGKDLKVDSYYFEKTGQAVILKEWGVYEHGVFYKVVRVYEGVSRTYEEGVMVVDDSSKKYVGELERVSELFADVPTSINSDAYKQKLEEVLDLGAEVRELETKANDLASKVFANGLKLQKVTKQVEVANKDLRDTLLEVDNAKDKLIETNFDTLSVEREHKFSIKVLGRKSKEASEELAAKQSEIAIAEERLKRLKGRFYARARVKRGSDSFDKLENPEDSIDPTTLSALLDGFN
jgi:hypothetical protein